MVAKPDHLLDPRYYPEQHDEWIREEFEMPVYGKGEENVTWRYSRENCDALLATRTLAGPWHIWRNMGHADRVIVLEKGEVSVQCPQCGLLNEWQWKWSPKEHEMPPKYGKRDSNHGAIKDAAQRMGATVIDTANAGQTCPGFPDMIWLVKGIERAPSGGFWREACTVWFVEDKNGVHATLTPPEERMRELIEGAGGQYIVVRSVDDVEKLLRRGG